jgi:predicted dehydrogenase
MDAVRIGIVGVGNMGSLYVKMLAAGEVDGACLAAVCDTDPARLDVMKARKIEGLSFFTDYREMIGSKAVNGIIITTPHYDHAAVATVAFEKGLHVLCEKPAGVYTRQVRAMNEAAARTCLV